jgi:hypothetical protein
LRNSNRIHAQIKSVPEQIVKILAERGTLLTSALVTVVDAPRTNPDKYEVINNSKYVNQNCDVFYGDNIAAPIPSA